jgi:uncharacterized protein YbcI
MIHEEERQGGEAGGRLATISNRLVQLHKDYYGKGPTRVKTYYQDDVVVVLLRGGFTRIEETLVQAGRGEAVIEQRRQFQEVMEKRFTEVVAELTRREVIACMSATHEGPDMTAEVFVLAPTEGSEPEVGPDPSPPAGP